MAKLKLHVRVERRKRGQAGHAFKACVTALQFSSTGKLRAGYAQCAYGTNARTAFARALRKSARAVEKTRRGKTRHHKHR